MARRRSKRAGSKSADGHSVSGFGCLSCVRGPDLAENQTNGMATIVSENSNGGKDMWDASAADRREPEVGAGGEFPDHLVIMVNGIIGSADNWRYAASQFVKKLPDKVFVHCSERNASTLTFDGVDRMGVRLAEEVKSIIENKPGLKKISFVAHSLGGLVARYAIGILYEPPLQSDYGVQNGGDSDLIDSNANHNVKEELKGKIAGLEPINFITFATPHLGSRGHKQLPLLCGIRVLENAATYSAHWFVGRTGKHLFLRDNDDGKLPLLRRMVTDYGDLRFMSALRSFKRRVAYANVRYDHMVGWRTSSIRRQSELPELRKVPINEKYRHIINVENGDCAKNTPRVSARKDDHVTDAIEEEMIACLTQVPWERVDVSFYRSRQRFLAHSTIQVKWYWMQSEGAHVICHMIDNFVI
ncbi:putative lipase ROG1 [Cryptomeria japonica]|uniref:putative lipase ROG1 n=1 Tax=Cryptomeria japonica TaxID=3369 RepID=UPI0025ACAE66|nr:putative lipase ROG1 [Cryptomeria japonica]